MIWLAVFQSSLLVCIFMGFSEDGGSLFLQNIISVTEKWFSSEWNPPIEMMSLIIKVGFLWQYRSSFGFFHTSFIWGSEAGEELWQSCGNK